MGEKRLKPRSKADTPLLCDVEGIGSHTVPVKKLLAPAVPFLYGKSYEEAEMDYYAILQKHIQRQVERTLERRAA